MIYFEIIINQTTIMHVTLRSYAFLSGILFAMIALVHAVRLYYGWEAIINGWVIPMWVCWTVVIIGVLIAWEAVKLSGYKGRNS